MNRGELLTCKAWFSDYVRSFYTESSRDNRNIELKFRHTSFVCENAVLIAEDEQWNGNDIMLAETSALFHDVGRFPQYAQHKTFLDRKSVNHGRLGADILREKQVLTQLPVYEQELILNTVRFHNAFEVPHCEDLGYRLFLHLIRDADKLDIWRVFAEYYQVPEDEKPSAVGLGLPDLPDCSTAVLRCLHDRKPAALSELKTLNDFKLLQISWVYGLQFRHTFRLLAERGLIGRIASTVPHTKEIAAAIAGVEDFIENRCGESGKRQTCRE